MRVSETSLPGVLVVEPDVVGDERGHFFEAYHAERYAAAGILGPFVQDNVSFSRRGTLRGLHLQNPSPQAKLVTALSGAVFDVAVDVRRGSPSYGLWHGLEISDENKKQVYLPAGFAHGFCVLSDQALFAYKCTAFYAPEAEITIAWNDPDIDIRWPREDVVLSPRDAAGLRLTAIDDERLPRYALQPLRSPLSR